MNKLPAKAVDAAARAMYERTCGAAVPGVIHGVQAPHVGYDTLAEVAITAALPHLAAAVRDTEVTA